MFLTFVTRACQRPKMLTENIASVKAQTCHDWEQIFIPDRERKSIQVADRALHENRHRVDGDYVYILDDDGMLLEPKFVESVKVAVQRTGADIVMVKSRRPPGPPSMQDVVPVPGAWGGNLYHGACNCLCYVMRAGLWKEHIVNFGVKPWGGDWWFLSAVLATNPTLYWLDMIVADARQLGRGILFEPVQAGWFEQVMQEQGVTNRGGDDWRLQSA